MGPLSLLLLLCFAFTIVQGVLMIWRGYSLPRLVGLIAGMMATACFVVLWLAWVRVMI